MDTVILKESGDSQHPEMISAGNGCSDHEEVKDELEGLKADSLYHEFLLDVSHNR